jgi:transketolase
MAELKAIQDMAKNIRIDSLKMVHRAKASHIGSALSCADILAVLYSDFADDKLILSKGHATVALYAALKHSGYNLNLEEYGQNGSPLMHHASHKVPGVEWSTGSLGHGLPVGVGKAMASDQHRVRVLVSDGELQEGSNWEAIMFAAHHKLNNLTMIVDYNNLQSITTVDETLSLEPLDAKLRAFGWDVQDIDGHDPRYIFKALIRTLDAEKPTAIICRTTKGKGVSFMENKVEWHYKYPDEKQLIQAIMEIEHA